MIGIVRLRQRVSTLIAQWRFKRSCLRTGNHLQVHGKCVISGCGAIIVGHNVMIKSPKHHPVDIFVSPNAELSIGDGTFINRGAHIACSERIRIGNGCLIGDDCVIIDNDFHGVGNVPVKVAPIVIADNVWLALRVIVLRGVTIGEGSVIGAGSVVNRSIPPYSFAAGAPARVIRQIEPKDRARAEARE
jgi:serine acetyltransferase